VPAATGAVSSESAHKPLNIVSSTAECEPGCRQAEERSESRFHHCANARQLRAQDPREDGRGSARVQARQAVRGHYVSASSKRGDTYLRTLLIHGARAVINAAQRKKAQIGGWLGAMIERRHKNVAAVALANKNARIVWALLRHGSEYKADYAAGIKS